MAGADYKHCDRCLRKVFYDAVLDWENGMDELGDWMVLCKDCTVTHEIVIKEK